MATPTQIRRRGRFSLILGTLVAALLLIAVAYADNVQGDNDLAANGNQTTINVPTSGTLAPGATANTSAQLVVRWQGGNHLATGDKVKLVVDPANTDLPAGYTVSPVTITIPSGWDANGDEVAGTSSISFTAPAADDSFTVTWMIDTSSGSPTAACATTNPKCVTGTPAYTINVDVTAPSDTTPPDTTITANPTNPSNSSSASFSFTGSDNLTPPASLTFECKLDSGAFAACTNAKEYAGLGEGSHTFQVRAKDQAGNVDPTPANYMWTIDTTPPSLSTIALQAGSDTGSSNSDRITNATTLKYELVFSETVTGVEASDFSTTGTATGCAAGNVTGSGTTYAVDLTGCSEGTVTLTFAANGASDAASNTGPTSAAPAAAVTIDRTAPVVASKPDVVVYTMSAPTTVPFTNPSATDASPASPTVTCNPASGTSFAQGETIVTCSATDTAGNTGQNTFKVIVNVLAVTFLKPVDASPLMNIAKLGRVIPVKVHVYLNGSALTLDDNPAITISGAGNVNCTSGEGSESVDEYAAAGSSNSGNAFRWDSTGLFWIYNYDTKALTGNKCYRLSVLYNGSVAGSFLINTVK